MILSNKRLLSFCHLHQASVAARASRFRDVTGLIFRAPPLLMLMLMWMFILASALTSQSPDTLELSPPVEREPGSFNISITGSHSAPANILKLSSGSAALMSRWSVDLNLKSRGYRFC